MILRFLLGINVLGTVENLARYVRDGHSVYLLVATVSGWVAVALYTAAGDER